MSTLFIALQCIQCSTMQVKQQKKSGGNNNKWMCVVCNLRQSVRRVHARGTIARDLRGFVQEFNLSRAVHGSDGSDPIPILRSSGSRAPDGFVERHKRRMDWSEYLDPHEKEEEEAGGGGDGGVMDLPPQNFENLSQKRIKRTESFKPDFSKRKRNGEKDSFPGQSSSQPSGMGPKKTLEAKVRSEWIEYLEEEEGTGETFGRDVCAEQSSRYYEHRGGKDQSQPSDSLVADEIHPDFK